MRDRLASVLRIRKWCAVIEMSMVSVVFICAALLCLIKCEELAKPDRNCRSRNRPIGSEKGDSYLLVDALLGATLELQCRYCNEKDDNQPKIWYKIDHPYSNLSREINIDMTSNLTVNNLHVTAQHTLILRNVSLGHEGLYYCQGSEGQGSEDKFKYFVDTVNNSSLIISGNISKWREYQKNYLAPVNGRFIESKDLEIAHVRDDLNIRLEVVTEWLTWGKCEICGRPLGAGRREKKGLCRIKATPFNQNRTSVVNTTNKEELFFLNIYELSCKSLLFYNLYPYIGNITKAIPNFLQIVHCKGICSPGGDAANGGWISGKSSGFKYRKTLVLAEKAHLTVICPESTLENIVIWRKNGRVLKAGESVFTEDEKVEPRITVDTFNTLYFIGVTHEEEGNYTCQVDNIKMQQLIVYVTSKSKLLTQAFVRYMMYLGFILSLTFSCYCAGVVVVCKNKRSFKTYEELPTDDDY